MGARNLKLGAIGHAVDRSAPLLRHRIFKLPVALYAQTWTRGSVLGLFEPVFGLAHRLPDGSRETRARCSRE